MRWPRLHDGSVYIGTTEGIVAYNPAMERKIIRSAAGRHSLGADQQRRISLPASHTICLTGHHIRSGSTMQASRCVTRSMSFSGPELENFDEAWGEVTTEQVGNIQPQQRSLQVQC
ncbi:MAG: hypothetical protein MZV63_18555 [Marinilabiliales bacterium]|nr:hypothetical protein [Marinilabiliales bacterium]